ncbi:hypothetical protein DPMN_123960 [Dreissena polymorpha]|uniref:Secreted protein n=1 Tax=Dreissena polymorpha TaxID=45954 RepID=A0A9D4JVT8_DREPO|nr:hypothetical protein DPMN_123960 [Dreissena polymorpha]
MLLAALCICFSLEGLFTSGFPRYGQLDHDESFYRLLPQNDVGPEVGLCDTLEDQLLVKVNLRATSRCVVDY